jgi:hypothetical protein
MLLEPKSERQSYAESQFLTGHDDPQQRNGSAMLNIKIPLPFTARNLKSGD